MMPIPSLTFREIQLAVRDAERQGQSHVAEAIRRLCAEVLRLEQLHAYDEREEWKGPIGVEHKV